MCNKCNEKIKVLKFLRDMYKEDKEHNGYAIGLYHAYEMAVAIMEEREILDIKMGIEDLQKIIFNMEFKNEK